MYGPLRRFPATPNRKSPRHPHLDYRNVAAYFVTVCADRHRWLFGEVVDARIVLNDVGRIVAEEWIRSEALRPEITLDAWVVMSNHMPGMVCIVPPGPDPGTISPRGYRLGDSGDFLAQDSAPTDDGGTTRAPSLPNGSGRRPNGPPARSLSSMIGGFKSAATRRIRRHVGRPDWPVWQSQFHDRILRHEHEWRTRRTYIDQNPRRWWEDRCSPKR